MNILEVLKQEERFFAEEQKAIASEQAGNTSKETQTEGSGFFDSFVKWVFGRFVHTI